MRALIASAGADVRQRIASALARDCTPALAASCAAATAVECPDLVFAESAWIAALRRAFGRRPYLIALVPARPAPTDFWAAYVAGADDVLRAGACSEEIAGKLRPFERCRAEPATASTTARIARVRAWEELPGAVAGDLGAMLDASLTPAPGSLDVCASSEICLVYAKESMVVRIGLGVDAATAAHLQHQLLGGDTSSEALADAMRELANTAAGAFKRAALDDGVELTIGQPSNANAFAAAAARGRRWVCAGGGLGIACLATASSVAPSQIPARELREGMVLARDVVNPSGVLLVIGGTYVTRTTADRLASLIGNALVEVAIA